MPKYYILQPDGLCVGPNQVSSLPNDPYEHAEQHLPAGTDAEHVSVLFNGKPCSMFVDEVGLHKDLPVNMLATAVYWAGTIQGQTGMRIESLNSPIVGTAVLWDCDVREG